MKKRIKKGIICKDIDAYAVDRHLAKSYIPVAGDAALFKVLELGKHTSIQAVDEQEVHIFPGDYLMGAFGNRYATSQFEGYVPDKIYKEYHILGKGAVMGIVSSAHKKLELVGPTTLKLIGYLTDSNKKVINTRYYKSLRTVFGCSKKRRYKVILSVGSSMNSGKTTTAAFLCRGLHNARKKVAYIKLTGTAYTKDKRLVHDCGADVAVDFTYAGFPSTYLCDLSELLNLYESLLSIVEKEGDPDFVVVEIADGLLQRETNMLLRNTHFMNTVYSIIFSCGDSLSALEGIKILHEMKATPFAVSGLLTTSPLFVEEMNYHSRTPTLTLDDLMSKDIIKRI